jgi:hypothetical protein
MKTLEKDPVRLTHHLQDALEATEKLVTINIAKDDLVTLKGGNYKLCFAKKVGTGDYNVVWQSYKDYLYKNDFSWVPMYELFGSNRFASSIQVSVSTNLVPIKLGETSILDEYGDMGKAKTGGPKTSFTLKNNFGGIHPGVNQLSTGIGGVMISTPIYVANDVAVKGDTVLTPVEKVLVWFEQNVETSTIFTTTRAKAIEIDLTHQEEQIAMYKNQEWILT